MNEQAKLVADIYGMSDGHSFRLVAETWGTLLYDRSAILRRLKNLEGKVLTLLEASMPPSPQLEALKSVVRQEINSLHDEVNFTEPQNAVVASDN